MPDSASQSEAAIQVVKIDLDGPTAEKRLKTKESCEMEFPRDTENDEEDSQDGEDVDVCDSKSQQPVSLAKPLKGESMETKSEQDARTKYGLFSMKTVVSRVPNPEQSITLVAMKAGGPRNKQFERPFGFEL